MTSSASGFKYVTPKQVMQRMLFLSAAFLVGTLLIFFLYRVVFLDSFSPSTTSEDAWRIYFSGVRLDSALVAIELLLLTTLFLLVRFFRLRPFAVTLILFTVVHIGLAVSNFLFFKERDQHLWEMLLANISHPEEIFIAIQPFLELHLIGVIVGFVLLVPLFVYSVKLCFLLPPMKLDMWKPRQHFKRSLMFVLFFFLFNLDPVAHQTTKYWRIGWIPLPTSSQLYMRFDSYQANQAVINPIHDFIRFYLPATIASINPDKVERMEPDKALSISQSLLGVQSGKDTYPMLRYLPAGPELGLKNVVVIQVEGLSQSLLHREEEGKAITPFLNDLSRRGFYFSNIVQNFNATDGSVFSTVTSIHKTFFNENWQYFLPVEVNGYFGSLPYLLGQEGYRHFAMHGFHNRREDFTSFMRNQGYQTVDILDFEKRLSTKWREEEHSNALGLFDGVFLNEAAEILSEVDSRFTAHLITATTHSPWMIPQVSPRPFTSDRSNTFHYLDSSIEAFFSNLKQNLSSFDETLFVIAADHTSVTYGGGAMERLRVPLIFYSPRLEKAMSRSYPETGKYGSHVDVLPTILQLLDGIQPYSGMGASLIARHRPKAGVISSNRYYSQYIKDGFVLRFSPFAPSTEEMQLFAIDNDEIIETDVSAAHPEIMKRLQAEFFSLYETSARLSKEKRLIPMVTVGAGMTIPGFDALASN